MLATAIGLTYLGVGLCYVASPSAPPDTVASVREAVPSAALRVGGGLLLTAGLACAAAARPMVDGMLMWLSMAMAACSGLVIAAPLFDRFVPVSSALAVVAVLLGLWT